MCDHLSITAPASAQRPEGAEEDQHHVPDHLFLLLRLCLSGDLLLLHQLLLFLRRLPRSQTLQPGAAALCQPPEGNLQCEHKTVEQTLTINYGLLLCKVFWSPQFLIKKAFFFFHFKTQSPVYNQQYSGNGVAPTFVKVKLPCVHFKLDIKTSNKETRKIMFVLLKGFTFYLFLLPYSFILHFLHYNLFCIF